MDTVLDISLVLAVGITVAYAIVAVLLLVRRRDIEEGLATDFLVWALACSIAAILIGRAIDGASLAIAEALVIAGPYGFAATAGRAVQRRQSATPAVAVALEPLIWLCALGLPLIAGLSDYQ